MDVKLKHNEALFVREYLRNGQNATAAVREIWGHLSPGSQREKGCVLLTRPNIIEAIMGATIKVIDDTIQDKKWLLGRIRMLLDFNIERFIRTDDNGQPYYDFSEATEDDWWCISELTIDTIGRGQGTDRVEVDRVKIKTEGKRGLLELYGKHVDVGAWEKELLGTGRIEVVISGKEANL